MCFIAILYTMTKHHKTYRKILHFLSYVEMGGPDECWRWVGSFGGDGRYGTYYSEEHAGGRVAAHRRSFELFNGILKSKEIVRHTCDHTWCVNPSHLLQGTQLNNMNDMALRNRHHNQRLSIPQIRAIYSDPRTQIAIAQEYAISQGYVSEIKSGKKKAVITRPKKLRLKKHKRT